MKTFIGIQLTRRQCTSFLAFVLILNLLVLLGSGLSNELIHVPKGPAWKFLLNQLNLGIENVLAAWYSSMLLFLVALAALLCFLVDRQQKTSFVSGALAFGWVLFSFIFLTLSLDEMGSFHESIGDTALFRQVGFGEGGGWNAFLVLIVLVALFMITFFVAKVHTSKTSFVYMLIGTLLFLSNPFQEAMEITSLRSAADPNNWNRPTTLFLLEEGSEIFGALCFLASMVRYAMDRNRQLRLSADGIRLHLPVTGNSLLRYIELPLLLGFAVMLLLYSLADGMPKGDDGIAVNWFPSVVFFAVALMAFFKMAGGGKGKTGYLLLAPLALLYAAYFGSDMYHSALLLQPAVLGLSLHALLLLLSAGLAVGLFLIFHLYVSRLLIAGYLLLTLFSFFSISIPVPFAGYLSAALLLGAITVQYVTDSEAQRTVTPVTKPAYSDALSG